LPIRDVIEQEMNGKKEESGYLFIHVMEIDNMGRRMRAVIVSLNIAPHEFAKPAPHGYGETLFLRERSWAASRDERKAEGRVRQRFYTTRGS